MRSRLQRHNPNLGGWKNTPPVCLHGGGVRCGYVYWIIPKKIAGKISTKLIIVINVGKKKTCKGLSVKIVNAGLFIVGEVNI